MIGGFMWIAEIRSAVVAWVRREGHVEHSFGWLRFCRFFSVRWYRGTWMAIVGAAPGEIRLGLGPLLFTVYFVRGARR